MEIPWQHSFKSQSPIDVARGPRNAMPGDGVRPDDEKLNVLGGQRVQHLGEVAIHPKDFR
jgi:hypothetical protein